MKTSNGTSSSREGVLRRRLLGAFLLLSLVPLFGSNALGYLRSRVIVERLVGRYLDGMAGLEAAHVEGRVEQRVLYLTAIGSGNRFLEAAIARHQGRPDLEMSGAADPASVKDYLTRKLEESGRFGALALFTADGALVSSTEGEGAVNAWPANGTAAITLLRSADDTAPPTFRMTVPVGPEVGEPDGYLVALIPSSQGGEFLTIPEHVAGSIESYIVDEEGRPIFVSHHHAHAPRYDSALESPLLDLAPGTHGRYRDHEGVEVIGASAVLPVLRWRFMMEVPTADALGELGALRNLSLMLGSLFAVLVLVAGWLLAGGIVAPVRRLVAAARALGAGTLDVRVPDPGRDEIGELSEAFNEMAAELQASQERLDLLHRREIERAQQLATVGELASGVAHEIKNPVVGISNGLDLVLRRVDDAALEPITSEMKRQLARIEGAVRDLLAFARPPRPEIAPADLNQVVGRALALVGPAAGKRHVAVVPHLGEHLPQVSVDAELIQQAVVNLLMNAVQISPEGGAVDVRTGMIGERIFVAVDDRGPGLGPEQLDQIFKPFYTTRHSGSGLGLPITRGIVEQHGGTVEVDSVPGEGSRFTLVLPVDPAAEAGRPA